MGDRFRLLVIAFIRDEKICCVASDVPVRKKKSNSLLSFGSRSGEKQDRVKRYNVVSLALLTIQFSSCEEGHHECIGDYLHPYLYLCMRVFGSAFLWKIRVHFGYRRP